MQGCLPSHLIFFRRHSSQARVTRRRFWMGWDGALGASSSPSLSDLMLADGDGASLSCQSWVEDWPASSSATSGDILGLIELARAMYLMV